MVITKLLLPVAATLLVLLVSSSARADIPVTDPRTVWSHGQEPSGNTIVAAGAAISAVVVAAGLVIGRWPVRTGKGRTVVAVVGVVALLGVWGVAGAVLLQAGRERGLWKQWEINESNRRSNWRGPPDFDRPPEPLPPSAPAPESSEPTPPTAAAESVQ